MTDDPTSSSLEMGFQQSDIDAARAATRSSDIDVLTTWTDVNNVALAALWAAT